MAQTALAQGRLEHFQAGGLRLCAKRWGHSRGLPVLAVHGWLDNCASFDWVAPPLAHRDWVCLDGAGHGRSDHRPHMGSYHLWQDVIELFWVADQLGWQQFDLVGHSRGAMIAFLAAGTCPERVRRLSLIEGIIPPPTPSAAAPELLASSLASLKLGADRGKRYYTSFEEAMRARTQGRFPVTQSDARALAEHGVIRTERGYIWQYDYKLMSSSALRYNKRQLAAFRDRVTAPVQLILGYQGILAGDQRLHQWVEKLPDFEQVMLAGGHHLHMSENGPGVAEAVERHFSK